MNTWSFGNRHTGSQGQEAGCSLSYQCRNRVLLSSTGDEAVGDFFPMGDVPRPCFTVIHHCRWIQWTISRASLCVSYKLLSPWKVTGCVWSLEGEGRREKEKWRVRLCNIVVEKARCDWPAPIVSAISHYGGWMKSQLSLALGIWERSILINSTAPPHPWPPPLAKPLPHHNSPVVEVPPHSLPRQSQTHTTLFESGFVVQMLPSFRFKTPSFPPSKGISPREVWSGLGVLQKGLKL